MDAPVERIAGADVPMPYAANLERLALPQVCFVPSLHRKLGSILSVINEFEMK